MWRWCYIYINVACCYIKLYIHRNISQKAAVIWWWCWGGGAIYFSGSRDTSVSPVGIVHWCNRSLPHIDRASLCFRLCIARLTTSSVVIPVTRIVPFSAWMCGMCLSIDSPTYHDRPCRFCSYTKYFLRRVLRFNFTFNSFIIYMLGLKLLYFCTINITLSCDLDLVLVWK